jgi:hypothetical protein
VEPLDFDAVEKNQRSASGFGSVFADVLMFVLDVLEYAIGRPGESSANIASHGPWEAC